MVTSEISVAALKADLFKALAHPLRIRALEKLADPAHSVERLSVTELAAQLGAEIAQVSQQLGVLRRANVVTTEREGNAIYYSVSDPRMSELLAVARQILLSNLQDSHNILTSLQEESVPQKNSTGRRPE